jgi:fucose permease
MKLESDDIGNVERRQALDTEQNEVHQLEDEEKKEAWNGSWRTISKIAATYYGFIVFGMFDSSLGALLPSIERYYGYSYLIVSLSFLAPFTGYVFAAVLSDHTHRWLGRRGAGCVGVALQLVCFIISLSGPPPFPLYVVGYGIGGFGNGMLEASWNSYMAAFDRANELTGLLHAFYGLGGIICPAVFTAMIENGYQWHLCYAVLVGMGSLSLIFVAIAFIKDTPAVYRKSVSFSMDTNSNSGIRMVIVNKLVWLLAVALFLYIGSEVTLSGWISTFMINIRHGNPEKMGYVTTGFWIGITLGRVVLGFVNGRIKKEELLASIYLSTAIVFILLFWLVPNLIVSAISAGVIGFFLGPLFPTIVVVAVKKLPCWLHVSGVGFASAFGGGGAAIVPFVNGVIADSYGPKILAPFTFSLLSAMFLIWLIVLKFF